MVNLGSLRDGIVEGFTIDLYLLLADYASRVVRKGKAAVSRELAGIFERLQSSAEIWSQRIKRLHGKTWVGRFLSASRDRLRELAGKLARHLTNIARTYLLNLNGSSLFDLAWIFTSIFELLKSLYF